ncbi:Las1-like-domain-containing protein [Chaetomium fimeti]|uniref:Las1-like-domain-containing protein n=1 Tax=Chaetomium fimeti TaxID=1854472 RepID=A0AAE0HMJ5_9PEZI|nr:Las1-like-domain-containing protein [Chaetomium fimeti]
MVQYIFTPWRNRHELLAVRAQFYPEHHHHDTTTNAPQTQRTQPQSQPQSRTNPHSRPWSQPQSQTRSNPTTTDTATTNAAAAKQQAVARVSMWMHRGGCPHMVESTALLMAAMLSDEGYGNGSGDGGVGGGNGGGSGGVGDGGVGGGAGGAGGSGAAAASRAYAVRAAYSAAFSRFVTGLLDSHQDKQRKMSMYDVAKSVGLPATFVELRHQATHEQLPSLPRLRAAAASALQWIWDYYWRGLEAPLALSSRSAALLARLPLASSSSSSAAGGISMDTDVREEEKELHVLLKRYLEGEEEQLKGEITRFSEGLVLTVLDSISGSTRDSTVMRRALALQRDILLNGVGADRMEEDEVPKGEGLSKTGLGAVSGGVLGTEAHWGGIGGIVCAMAVIYILTAQHVRFHCCQTSFPAQIQILFINCQWAGKSDNYAYLVVDDKSKEAVIIDPAHPADHWDHAGGNEELLSELGQPLEIIGGKDCKKVTKTPAHGTTFNIGDIAVKALHTPCHTQDSICFFMQDGEDKVVFTGDTLFHGGELFFEGNGEEMHKALNVTLGSLPDDTRVFYTGANAKFGVSVLPSEPVKALESFAKDNRETQGKFTIGDEKKHNWLWQLTREQDPAIQKATGETDPIAIMTKLREMKNNFK